MSKTYLVQNIKINDDKPIDVTMATIYESNPLAQVIFRSYVCDFEFSFDHVLLDETKRHVTEYVDKWQQFDYDLIYRDYEENHNLPMQQYEIIPLHASRCVVELTDDDISQYDEEDEIDIIEQCIYEKLIHCLPISFVFKAIR